MDPLRPILYHLQPLVLLGSPLPVPLAGGFSHAAPNMFLKPDVEQSLHPLATDLPHIS